MADRNQTPKPQKAEHAPAETEQSRGGRIGKVQDAQHKLPIVGEEVADESKERHTEIAVEAGHHHGGERNDKNR